MFYAAVCLVIHTAALGFMVKYGFIISKGENKQ